jgi:hypothetical protein
MFGDWKYTMGEVISIGYIDAWSIVLQLLIEDAVPNRLSRLNIMNPAFHDVGISTGNHAESGSVTTINFAGGFCEKC